MRSIFSLVINLYFVFSLISEVFFVAKTLSFNHMMILIQTEGNLVIGQNYTDKKKQLIIFTQRQVNLKIVCWTQKQKEQI
jgi:hypothetical protein